VKQKFIIMNDVFLQSIVEKLEALEIALLKGDNSATISEAQQPIIIQLKSCQSGIESFSRDLRNLNAKIEALSLKVSTLPKGPDEKRQDHTIHHHHIHKGLWISIGLFLILTISIAMLINTRDNFKAYEANDIKYRRLKVQADTALLKRLYRMDSLFTIDPEAFTKYTVEEENRIAERARLFRLAGEKEGEAKELRKRATSHLLN
jgi:hypothetical protein